MKKLETKKLLRLYVVFSSLLIVVLLGGVIYADITVAQAKKEAIAATKAANSAGDNASQADSDAQQTDSDVQNADKDVQNADSDIQQVCNAISGC